MKEILIKTKEELFSKRNAGFLTFFTIFALLLGMSYGPIMMKRTLMPDGFRHLIVTPVSAHELADSFTCPCCGESVADCECGMAVERRDFIQSHFDSDEDTLEILTKYAQEYDLTEFTEESLSSTISDYLKYIAPEDRPQIVIAEDTLELEDLIQAEYSEGERLEMEFEVENTGSKDLIINGIDSSCMCTKAKLITDSQESPEGGMDHGEEAIEEWEIIIKAGEKATLAVSYDPNAHGEFAGEITRTVTLESNDPINQKLSVTFELEQI